MALIIFPYCPQQCPHLSLYVNDHDDAIDNIEEIKIKKSSMFYTLLDFFDDRLLAEGAFRVGANLAAQAIAALPEAGDFRP